MRSLRRAAAAIAAAGVILAAVLLTVFARSVPPRSGREPLPELRDTVTVVFDELAIPFISASNDLDAFAALGYMHARERLWQMELVRRTAEGRLAEVLGPAALSSDRFLRTLDVPRAAERSLALMPAETRAVLDAYVRGVNAWIRGRPRPLPPEFQVLRLEPEPWTARQSVEVARMMAWDLANAAFELDQARVAARVGAERALQLGPAYPDDGPVILPDGAGRWDTARVRSGSRGAAAVPPSALLAAADAPVIPPLAEGLLEAAAMSRASNSWVVGPARSRSGRPILANDPHLALRAPSLWYLAVLSSPGYRTAGATIPGLPAVVLGRNGRIAWGCTNVGVDDVDFVIERLSDDSSEVLTPGGWVPTEVERESIAVRGSEPVPFTLVRTSHGPLVDRDVPDRDPNTGVAMRWNAHEASDELTAMLAVDRAGDWAEFSAALSGFLVPEQNWVYADVDGNFGYRMNGRVPVRRRGDGSLPTPGWTDEGMWERYLGSRELPWALNPPEGFVVTANNRVVGPEYPHLLTRSWELPWRAARIRELLSDTGRLTADDVERMQLDTVDLFARSTREFAARAADGAGRPDIGRGLRAWDGTAGTDRTEPTLFYVWYRAFQRLALEDETGEPASSGVTQRWLRAGDSPWCDDVRTPSREDCAALAVRAMREAIPVAEGVPWGRVHRTLSAHTLGRVRVLAGILRLSLGPAPRAGSPYTVNVASFGRRLPFTNTFAASFRHVVDLSDIDRGRMIITTGQAGNPLSRHYRDQAGRWWNGRLWTVPLGIDERAGASTLRLTPAR